MKKIFALLITTIILLTACQPTPENLIVQNKADGELMEKIEATAVANSPVAEPGKETSQASEQEEEDYNKYKIIGHEEFEKTLVNGMHLVADADVEIPDVETFPIIKFQRKEFSQEDLDKVLNTLIGDKQLYEYESPMTVGQIEDALLWLKLKLSEGDISEEQLNSINHTIEYYKEKLETAPENAGLVEKSKLLNESSQVFGKVMLEDGFCAGINIVTENKNRTNFDDSQIGIRYSILGRDNMNGLWTLLQTIRGLRLAELTDTTDYYDGRTLEPSQNAEGKILMTPEEAVKLAEETFRNLGAGENVKVSDIFYLYIQEDEITPSKDIHCYALQLKRYIGDTPIQVYFSNNQGMERRSNDGSDEFNSNLPYESMSVFISDDGIIDLEWREPLEAVEVMNENVELVPYEKIIEVFKQEFTNSYSSYFWRTENEKVENKGLKKTITYEAFGACNLYSIKLNYGIARMPNQNNYYMAIPLWDFYAWYSCRSWEGTDAAPDNVKNPILDFDMMTINVVDSSRFSRQWGY